MSAVCWISSMLLLNTEICETLGTLIEAISVVPVLIPAKSKSATSILISNDLKLTRKPTDRELTVH